VRVIKDAIRDIGGEGKRASIDHVIDTVTNKGFAKEKVREGIDMLLRNGEAMEPKNGIIQLI
jgi:replicative DNA helicase Mcm